jgi:biopolymer transport protein ExbB/TolQ
VSQFNSWSNGLLRSPLLWGAALACCFFGLVHGGVITNPVVIRYLAGHWVEYVEVALFCVGLAALAMKTREMLAQQGQPNEDFLGPIPEDGQPPEEAAALAATLPKASGYLPRRLGEALDYVRRTGTANELDDHLKYLSDLDTTRAQQSYGLVRFIVWAIPIMGFLGTVIGITVAIANLSPTEMENIGSVVAGLGTAFDTTATALTLAMVLMFLQFTVDRAEQRLLARVDDAAWRSLTGRFHCFGDEGTAVAVARLGDTLGRGTARLMDAQVQAWRGLEKTAAAGIRQVVEQASETLRTSLGDSVERWGEAFARTHDELAGQREERWTAAAEVLGDAVRGLERQQHSLASQQALLGNVLEATRDITTLERTLEDNLATLSATGRFEETIATLTAAVQLLAARAGDATPARRTVDLNAARTPGKAA